MRHRNKNCAYYFGNLTYLLLHNTVDYFTQDMTIKISWKNKNEIMKQDL